MTETNTIQDLIRYSYDQKPIEFETTFKDLMNDRIAKAIEDRKLELAQSMVTDSEESGYDIDDEEDFNQEDHNEEEE